MICENVKEILNKYQIYAKKMYGQNFLLDKNVLEKIIKISNITKEDIVIEIGPGIGCLTEYLAINSKCVVAYEIDKDMVEILHDTLRCYNNVEIKHMDFMKADLSEYQNVQNVKVVANLPYYITTAIITKLLLETKINNFTFMVQKEVGDRITGIPNTKDYNALSVIMKYMTNSYLASPVSRNCFYPVPNVESALLVVSRKKSDYTPKNEANFLKFIQNAFLQRRKTLINNLNQAYGINKSKLEEALNENQIKINCRAEELSDVQIFNIYQTIFEK